MLPERNTCDAPVEIILPRSRPRWPWPPSRATPRSELASRSDVHAHQIGQWKQQLVAQAAEVFTSEGVRQSAAPPVDLKALHAKIGQQALEIDFLAGALGRLPGSSAKR